LLEIEGDIVVQALDGDKLKPELVKQGVKLSRILEPSISYHYWNMQNPVVGGFTPEKIALRRAMAMAFSVENMISVLLKGDGAKLHMPVPPGVERSEEHTSELQSRENLVCRL